MADITTHFTIYKGDDPGDLKHVATVLRQSNGRDGLQLIKQSPYNENIFIHPKNTKSVLEFLVPNKPLKNTELVPIILLFFVSNLILDKYEYAEFKEMFQFLQKKNNSRNIKWASLENQEFYKAVTPFIEKVITRLDHNIQLEHPLATDDRSQLLVTSFFKSPMDDEIYSVVSYNTEILTVNNSNMSQGETSW